MEKHARQWWPVSYADEVMPPGRATPDGFIVRLEGVLTLGYDADEKLVDEQDRGFFNKPIAIGDIVNFICLDNLGAVEVEINADGSYTAHGDVPEAATSFMETGNPDSLADSLPEYAKNVADLFKGDDDADWPKRDDVRMARWSDEVPHKLIATADGPRFELVSKAEAKQ